MSKIYHLYQTDVFTKKRFTGNPAGVITNADGLSVSQMQQIARELNNSETAFVFTEGCRDYDMQVRFFTPTHEVPICGHATIAAHYTYAMENHWTTDRRNLQKTGAGILPVDIYRKDSDYLIAMTQGDVQIASPLSSDCQRMIAQALGLKMDDLRDDCPMVIASTGHSKVLVGMKNLEQLHELQPNLAELSRISKVIGCIGYYTFVLDKEKTPLVHGRMFAPAIGIPEDPVTGNANGPLGAYLVHFGIVDVKRELFSFEAIQGESIGRAGTMTINVSIIDKRPVSVQILGNAVIVFSADLELS